MESPDPPPTPPPSQRKKPRLSFPKDRSKRSRKKGGGEVRTGRSDVKGFVHEVCSLLRDDGVKYMRFLNIMRSYKLKSFSYPRRKVWPWLQAAKIQ